jgi:RNase P/RNase MRP subunit p30
MKFSDLHLRVPWNDLERAKGMIVKSSELGFSQIGVPLPPSAKPEVADRLRQICADVGVDFVSRVELYPRSSSDLLSSLRRFRRLFEIVSVVCRSKPSARQAAKDRRVDLLCFEAVEWKKRFFDRAEAELASKSSAGFEIDLAQVLTLEGFSRVSLLSSLRREVATARSFGVPVVLSSGAADSLLLRKPEDYASLAFLFDMGASSALDALSRNPLGIVERNRMKLSEEYVAPGVRVARRGRGKNR